MNDKANPFPGKRYTIGKKVYQMEPLSFFDLLDLPEHLVRIAEALPKGEASPGDIAAASKGEIKALVCKAMKIELDELKEIPAKDGMEILADFLEMNLNENFSTALRRALRAAQKIFSQSFKS